MGLPAPVRAVATSKAGSRLLMVILPILLATGILSVSFSGGIPQFTFNRQRAEEVRAEIEADVARAEAAWQSGRSGQSLPRR